MKRIILICAILLNVRMDLLRAADAVPAQPRPDIPSFFGYLKYAVLILLPVLIAAWALFIL